MESTFREFLEILAQGRDLSSVQADNALKKIVGGQVSSEEVAAFLMGMRSKGETVEELVSFVRVMRDSVIPVRAKKEGAIDLCGTGGDRSGTFNISTAAMFVAAGAGVPILKHGNRSVSSKCGSADVLETLGAVVDLQQEAAEELFRKTGVVFMFAPNFHPAMKHVMPARRAMRIRTFFNILGPLLNPAGVHRQVVGAFNEETARMMARILSRLDTEHAITVHALDGLDEVSTTGPSLLCHVEKGRDVREEIFDPESLGLKRARLEELKGGDAAENAELIQQILAGRATRSQEEMVLLNAAFGIAVSGRVGSVAEGLEAARESIRSGEATRALDRFVTVSRELSSSAK
ncbi:MAG: anthranilate phosphoribosyltransferase [Bacteroidota bacterium]